MDSDTLNPISATTWPDTLPLKPVTKGLLRSMMRKLPLTPAALADFHITDKAHFDALQAAVFSSTAKKKAAFEAKERKREAQERKEWDKMVAAQEKRFRVLDAALGNGKKLRAFVKKYAPEHASRVDFNTLPIRSDI